MKPDDNDVKVIDQETKQEIEQELEIESKKESEKESEQETKIDSEQEAWVLYKKYKKKYWISLVIILLLSFTLYGQWASRTDMYISARTSLENHIVLYKFYIEMYLRDGDIGHLRGADSYSDSITAGAKVFTFYYQDKMGRELTTNFRKIFSKFDFYVVEATDEELKQKVEDAERILDAIYKAPMLTRYATNNSLIPLHPYSKKMARKLLVVTEEIINRDLEHDSIK